MTNAGGFEFTEWMRGHVSPDTRGARSHEEYVAAAARGKAAGTSIGVELTIRAADFETFRDDPMHRATLTGTALAPGLGDGQLSVKEGFFDCLSADPEHPDTKNMWYRMVLSASDGGEYYFEGYKVLTAGALLNMWPQTTTLYVTLRKGTLASDPVVAQGLMRVHARDFLRQMTTLHAVSTEGRPTARRASADFVRFFARSMVESYGGAVAPTRSAPERVDGRTRRSLRAPAPKTFPVKTEGGTEIRLTRYNGGRKGPVMLSHGLGVSSLIFSIDTIETNLVEFLVGHGYDVWSLDHRASTDLPSAAMRFTADEVARLDYPAAAAAVRELTGSPDIQVVAHCFGSTTFFMAMLSGLHGVRAAVCSQIACHIDTPPLTRVKAAARLDRLLDTLRIETMTARTPSNGAGAGRLLDNALRLMPASRGEACRSEVCHRITLLYGLLYQHRNLNTLTHDALHEMFGTANVGSLNHLATMVRAKHIVDAAGRNIYLPHVDRLGIPISILHGAENDCFLPSSTERTVEWMAAANGSSFYDRRVIPGYGHIDCIFGRDAARDVFPYVVERLDLTAA